MYPCKLKPALKDYIWGGNRLVSEYGIESRESIVAEAWMLSCNGAGASTIIGGPLDGLTLTEALFAEIEKTLGSRNPFSVYFPILIKFLDAKNDLSVQVHPSNGYALDHEGEFGKTELWYILDAQEDACIHYGFSRALSGDELREHIQNNTIMDALKRVPVKKGDVFLIEAGTVHAIGKGIVLVEIQQNSNATYRVYDYDRKDAQGNRRELHVEKAIAVTNTSFVPTPPIPAESVQEAGYIVSRLASCEWFTVDLLKIDSSAGLSCDDTSFTSLLFVEGIAKIIFDNDAYGKNGVIEAAKGESVFLPAGTGSYRIEGQSTVLKTTR